MLRQCVNTLLVGEFAMSPMPTELTALLPDREWDSHLEDNELGGHKAILLPEK
jgi:hypothetical protein